MVDGRVVGQIGRGLVVLLGVAQGDGIEDAQYLADRTANLRIFPDHAGKFNLSALEVGGETLVVSQFTLLADTRKGRRPSFIQAAPPEEAGPLVTSYVDALQRLGLGVETGVFQAHMVVEIHNDGPVTVLLESK
jgi:D-tyrosyl-tRNA(Tyr) deacylase